MGIDDFGDAEEGDCKSPTPWSGCGDEGSTTFERASPEPPPVRNPSPPRAAVGHIFMLSGMSCAGCEPNRTRRKPWIDTGCAP